MVSGFFTSPWDHSRIFSGLASEMRMAEKDSGSFGFSKKEKMSRIRGLLVGLREKKSRKLRVKGDESRAPEAPLGAADARQLSPLRPWRSLSARLRSARR